MSMLSLRAVSLVALVPLVVVAACSDNNNDEAGINVGNAATVGFVNATGNGNITVANNGVVGTGNGNLVPGAASSCMTINPSANALTFTNATTSAPINGFAPSFLPGNHYTVIAYTDASGNTQFATVNNAFTPNSGSAGVTVFNGAFGSGNVVALGNGTAFGTGTGVAFGSNGSFFSVPAGTQPVTWNTGTGTSTIANAGNLTFNAGQNYVLLLTPASSGATTLNSFLVPVC